MKTEFVWTDELVLEFARISTQGSYGIYNGAKSLESKMTIFKNQYYQSKM